MWPDDKHAHSWSVRRFEPEKNIQAHWTINQSTDPSSLSQFLPESSLWSLSHKRTQFALIRLRYAGNIPVIYPANAILLNEFAFTWWQHEQSWRYEPEKKKTIMPINQSINRSKHVPFGSCHKCPPEPKEPEASKRSPSKKQQQNESGEKTASDYSPKKEPSQSLEASAEHLWNSELTSELTLVSTSCLLFLNG